MHFLHPYSFTLEIFINFFYYCAYGVLYCDELLIVTLICRSCLMLRRVMWKMIASLWKSMWRLMHRMVSGKQWSCQIPVHIFISTLCHFIVIIYCLIFDFNGIRVHIATHRANSLHCSWLQSALIDCFQYCETCCLGLSAGWGCPCHLFKSSDWNTVNLY